MILAITAVHLGDIAMVGLLAVGLGWIWHLGRRLIDLGIDAMRDSWRRHHEPSPLEYADFYTEPVDDTEALADSLRYPDLDEDQVCAEVYGNHAAVPPPTPAETTGYMPRINQLPVDDEAALRVVESLSPGGER